MPPLNAATLLTAWEQGVLQHPVQRSLTLLAAWWPDKCVDDWSSVSIGERDRHLLRLREELFGPTLEAIAICPKCGEQLELALNTPDLHTSVSQASATAGRLHLQTGIYEMNYRLPTSADLLEIANTPAASARELLVQRCVEARKRTSSIDPATLPASVLKLVGEKMAEADPQAEVQIALNCPTCAHKWSTVFDILSYLWGEIEDWADRLLLEVHTLASAYGWSERDIIAMSARRRRLYLEMVGAN